MEEFIDYLSGINPILAAFYAVMFTWTVTALGASLVFFIKTMNCNFLDASLEFIGGVMIVASIWSLLIREINMSKSDCFMQLVPVIVRFFLFAEFLFAFDKSISHLHINFKQVEGVKSLWQKTTLLILAITLHNILEGLAV